jgi:hypothetical protein
MHACSAPGRSITSSDRLGIVLSHRRLAVLSNLSWSHMLRGCLRWQAHVGTMSTAYFTIDANSGPTSSNTCVAMHAGADLLVAAILYATRICTHLMCRVRMAGPHASSHSSRRNHLSGLAGIMC